MLFKQLYLSLQRENLHNRAAFFLPWQRLGMSRFAHLAPM